MYARAEKLVLCVPCVSWFYVHAMLGALCVPRARSTGFGAPHAVWTPCALRVSRAVCLSGLVYPHRFCVHWDSRVPHAHRQCHGLCVSCVLWDKCVLPL